MTQFSLQLFSLLNMKIPISKAKMIAITRNAMKAIKFYKHVVQSVEKFIQKCKVEYKIPGLYVIDSIVRQSRHQFGTDKDVFAPRFARNMEQTFIHIYRCPPEEKVSDLWIYWIFRVTDSVFVLEQNHPSAEFVAEKQRFCSRNFAAVV